MNKPRRNVHSGPYTPIAPTHLPAQFVRRQLCIVRGNSTELEPIAKVGTLSLDDDLRNLAKAALLRLEERKNLSEDQWNAEFAEGRADLG